MQQYSGQNYFNAGHFFKNFPVQVGCSPPANAIFNHYRKNYRAGINLVEAEHTLHASCR
jgi:hypothetical protein